MKAARTGIPGKAMACSAILSFTAIGTAAGGLAVTNYFCIR